MSDMRIIKMASKIVNGVSDGMGEAWVKNCLDVLLNDVWSDTKKSPDMPGMLVFTPSPDLLGTTIKLMAGEKLLGAAKDMYDQWEHDGDVSSYVNVDKLRKAIKDYEAAR
jgi:hypothetical protein